MLTRFDNSPDLKSEMHGESLKCLLQFRVPVAAVVDTTSLLTGVDVGQEVYLMLGRVIVAILAECPEPCIVVQLLDEREGCMEPSGIKFKTATPTLLYAVTSSYDIVPTERYPGCLGRLDSAHS
jgi:hypothetical protein